MTKEEYKAQYRALHRAETAAYNKKYRAGHHEEHRACIKKYAAALRQKCLSVYGGKCACCGESIERFLTIDHVNGEGAKHRRSIRGAIIYRWLIKHDFPEGFQILCWNCNMGRQLNGGICPHKETCGENIILAPQVTGRQSANT